MPRLREAVRGMTDLAMILLGGIVFVAVLWTMLAYCAGCTEGAVQVNAAPQIPAEAVKLVIEPGAILVDAAPTIPAEAVRLSVERGAITTSVNTPPLPEGPLDKLSTWVGIAVVAGVVLWFLPAPHRIIGWVRGNGGA